MRARNRPTPVRFAKKESTTVDSPAHTAGAGCARLPPAGLPPAGLHPAVCAGRWAGCSAGGRGGGLGGCCWAAKRHPPVWILEGPWSLGLGGSRHFLTCYTNRPIDRDRVYRLAGQTDRLYVEEHVVNPALRILFVAV